MSYRRYKVVYTNDPFAFGLVSGVFEIIFFIIGAILKVLFYVLGWITIGVGKLLGVIIQWSAKGIKILWNKYKARQLRKQSNSSIGYNINIEYIDR